MITEYIDDTATDPATTDHAVDGGQDEAYQPRKGGLAGPIERATAKMPPDLFLWAAFGSIGASLGLQFAGRRHASLFVGQWAPTFLALGLYNKLAKVASHDRAGRPQASPSAYSRD